VRRLAIVSDTHLPRGSRAMPDACVERMRGADAILHAGDLMEPEVLAELKALGPPVFAVAGNVDAPELQIELPATRLLDVDGVKIAMLHNAGPAEGRFERMRRRFPDAQALIFGHSHLPLLEQRDGFAIFNPGSPTERRSAPHHTMGMATVEDGRIEFELIVLD
jgi:putative phosphoesterase